MKKKRNQDHLPQSHDNAIFICSDQITSALTLQNDQPEYCTTYLPRTYDGDDHSEMTFPEWNLHLFMYHSTPGESIQTKDIREYIERNKKWADVTHLVMEYHPDIDISDYQYWINQAYEYSMYDVQIFLTMPWIATQTENEFMWQYCYVVKPLCAVLGTQCIPWPCIIYNKINHTMIDNDAHTQNHIRQYINHRVFGRPAQDHNLIAESHTIFEE